MRDHLAPELRGLVRRTVALLGEVIRRELGEGAYRRIERVRRTMSALRGRDPAYVTRVLGRELRALERLDRRERADFARAYTLMLELMNACENAYRGHRIRRRVMPAEGRVPDSIIYVLTAHPTEARSPQNIAVFHEILRLLMRVLERPEKALLPPDLEALRNWIEVAWKSSVARVRKPRVQDEAEHVYSTLLREETLAPLLSASRELAPVYVRSWVGGDKDGHPGVDERAFVDSLQLSRQRLLAFTRPRLEAILASARSIRSAELVRRVRALERELRGLRAIAPGDGRRVARARAALRHLVARYLAELGAPHPALSELRQLVWAFPGFVVPLEFRESSDLIVEAACGGNPAISRMLARLAAVSRGGQPRWYVRGLIISMAGSLAHILAAARLVRRRLGSLSIPVVPLFEQSAALNAAPGIVSGMLATPAIRRALARDWDGYLEVMLGYSDSAKESGVLPSRLQIARTMGRLDRLCRRAGVKPVFFQGSGGSVDRGGGTVREQTAGWPAGALRNYKVTLQGEMIERSLASPEITRGQIERIVEAVSASMALAEAARGGARDSAPEVLAFAARVAERYRATVASPDFLEVVERATPYPFLDVLRIGSRPSKRAARLSVPGLRAIPWVLCWTQTRVLFPTWWGVGSAWEQASRSERRALARAYRRDPRFATFVRALGFTLAKVELPVWRHYLEQGGFSPREVDAVADEFARELRGATAFARAVTGRRNLLAWRPWLEESIFLRSPMIHPLNLLQILAMRDGDAELLRITVTGVSSGMMTTG
jgi:phosphoenolpyruvate carboxylase